MLPLALTRNDIADYVDALFLVFIVLIFVRILLSWVPRVPYNRTLYAVIEFINQVTNPYLNIFRRLLPPVGAGGMGLDLSPILALIVLYVLRGFVVNIIAG